MGRHSQRSPSSVRRIPRSHPFTTSNHPLLTRLPPRPGAVSHITAHGSTRLPTKHAVACSPNRPLAVVDNPSPQLPSTTHQCPPTQRLYEAVLRGLLSPVPHGGLVGVASVQSIREFSQSATTEPTITAKEEERLQHPFLAVFAAICIPRSV